jgi:hypothetical protein
LAFVLNPIYGRWSDARGRRPFILLSAVATTLPYVALATPLPLVVYLVLRCVCQGALGQVRKKTHDLRTFLHRVHIILGV